MAAAAGPTPRTYHCPDDIGLRVTNPVGVDGSFVNRRNQTLHTVTYLPKGEPKAAVFLCHGYCSYVRFMASRSVDDFCAAGFAVFGIDHVGHGESDCNEGYSVYITEFNDMVEDFTDFVAHTKKVNNITCKSFIVGESMGGAISVLATMPSTPGFDLIDGVVLVAPMVRISQLMKPPEWQITLLRWVCNWVPTWAVTPTPDLMEHCFRDEEQIEVAKKNPYSPPNKPRLQSALQLNEATESIDAHMEDVKVPFLVLHGETDMVTDLDSSRTLHTRASSTDKTIKTYPGLYHALFFEPEGQDKVVLTDIVDWITARA